nr:MAG TPA: hypothetical protein [Caudoviricetes sp.]
MFDLIIPIPWGKCYTNNTQKYNSFIVIFAIRHINLIIFDTFNTNILAQS